MSITHHDRRTLLKWLGVAAALALIAAGVALGMTAAVDALHGDTSAADVGVLVEPAPKAPYYLDVRVKVVGQDLDKETVTLSLESVKQWESYLDASGQLDRGRDRVVLLVGDSAGVARQRTVIPSGVMGAVTTVDLDLNGNVEDYPWDRHTTTVSLYAMREPKGGPPEAIPIRLRVYGSWPALRFRFAATSTTAGGWLWHDLGLTVARSSVTRFVVDFSIVLTWVLIVSVVGMTLWVVLGKRRIEIPMLAYFGTLLFAMTAFRDALPGAPPMGTLSDYLAFFWGFAVAIVAVGVVSGVWLWRRPVVDGRPPA